MRQISVSNNTIYRKLMIFFPELRSKNLKQMERNTLYKDLSECGQTSYFMRNDEGR